MVAVFQKLTENILSASQNIWKHHDTIPMSLNAIFHGIMKSSFQMKICDNFLINGPNIVLVKQMQALRYNNYVIKYYLSWNYEKQFSDENLWQFLINGPNIV